MKPLSELTPSFLDHITRTRALRTAQTYRNAIGRFVAFAGARPLSAKEFIAFPGWLLGQGYSKQTMGVYMAAAKAFMDWLIIESIFEPNYADGVRLRMARQEAGRRRESRLPRSADPAVVEAVRARAYGDNATPLVRLRTIALIEFLYSTGCRINEACTLTIKNIDIGKRMAKVNGKGSKERWVTMSEVATRRLQEYWELRGDRSISSRAFQRHDDGASGGSSSLSTVGARESIKQVAAWAGYPEFHPHLFRHHFATKLLSATGNLAAVQDILGHASPASTRVYAKIQSEELAAIHDEVFR